MNRKQPTKGEGPSVTEYTVLGNIKCVARIQATSASINTYHSSHKQRLSKHLHCRRSRWIAILHHQSSIRNVCRSLVRGETDTVGHRKPVGYD
jgi:hypothetical protein